MSEEPQPAHQRSSNVASLIRASVCVRDDKSSRTSYDAETRCYAVALALTLCKTPRRFA
jgi:hypothetical protein